MRFDNIDAWNPRVLDSGAVVCGSEVITVVGPAEQHRMNYSPDGVQPVPAGPVEFIYRAHMGSGTLRGHIDGRKPTPLRDEPANEVQASEDTGGVFAFWNVINGLRHLHIIGPGNHPVRTIADTDSPWFDRMTSSVLYLRGASSESRTLCVSAWHSDRESIIATGPIERPRILGEWVVWTRRDRGDVARTWAMHASWDKPKCIHRYGHRQELSPILVRETNGDARVFAQTDDGLIAYRVLAHQFGYARIVRGEAFDPDARLLPSGVTLVTYRQSPAQLFVEPVGEPALETEPPPVVVTPPIVTPPVVTPPSGGHMPRPLEPKHSALIQEYARVKGMPGLSHREGQEWILGLAETFAARWPDEGWGRKSAGGGRPISNESIARKLTTDEDGDRRVDIIGYDLIRNAGAANQELLPHAHGEDIDDQDFHPVTPKDHLAGGGGTTPPTPGVGAAPNRLDVVMRLNELLKPNLHNRGDGKTFTHRVAATLHFGSPSLGVQPDPNWGLMAGEDDKLQYRSGQAFDICLGLGGNQPQLAWNAYEPAGTWTAPDRALIVGEPSTPTEPEQPEEPDPGTKGPPPMDVLEELRAIRAGQAEQIEAVRNNTQAVLGLRDELNRQGDKLRDAFLEGVAKGGLGGVVGGILGGKR